LGGLGPVYWIATEPTGGAHNLYRQEVDLTGLTTVALDVTWGDVLAFPTNHVAWRDVDSLQRVPTSGGAPESFLDFSPSAVLVNGPSIYYLHEQDLHRMSLSPTGDDILEDVVVHSPVTHPEIAFNQFGLYWVQDGAEATLDGAYNQTIMLSYDE